MDGEGGETRSLARTKIEYLIEILHRLPSAGLGEREAGSRGVDCRKVYMK